MLASNTAGKFRTFYASYEEWVKHKQHRIASSGEFLAKQLSENPAVAKEWDAKRWSNLVAAKPEFADRCPWRKLGGGDWEDLLIMQPQFADKCAWSKLTTDNWKTASIMARAIFRKTRTSRVHPRLARHSTASGQSAA